MKYTLSSVLLVTVLAALTWGAAPQAQGPARVTKASALRAIPAETTARPPAQSSRESLTPEEFARRAGGDEASRDRAVNQETILRNEFGVRTFGYTSRGERVYDQAVADAKARGLPVAPRTMGMEVYSGGNVEGRQPVREIGFGR